MRPPSGIKPPLVQRARGSDRGPVVWRPSPEGIEAAGVTHFLRWLAEHRGIELAGYNELWEWSVDELEEFWAAIWDYSGVIFHAGWERVLSERKMPGAAWFEGAKLNFAENALRRDDDDPILEFQREDGLSRELTARELRTQVGAVAASMRALGVRTGDCVAAVLPNCPEAIVAFLATASIGAIWTLCGPETGAKAISDRFAQVKPVLLLSVDGYLYAGKHHDISGSIAEALRGIPSVKHHVLISYVGDANPTGALTWESLVNADGILRFEHVPFDHPLWIVYSSGTTGGPKAIVHGHGGILIEQLKVQKLHDSTPPSGRHRALTLASPSWIVWNLQVSYLLIGATLVLYDGSPLFPSPSRVWQLVADRKVSIFRASAAWLSACVKAGIAPGRDNDLGALRTLLSTGSPLSAEAFYWIRDRVGAHVQPTSSSGGTELCTALVTGVSVLPIRAGEIQCRALGAAVHAFDPDGKELLDEAGELVVTAPMPSMPLYFWNDPNGERLHQAYFAEYPGIWRHGDWIRIHPDGSSVILGRSDASLNRGGVRTGAAEFYGALEFVPEVIDALVVDLATADASGELLLFVVLVRGETMNDQLRESIRHALRTQLSPRHVPSRIVQVSDLPYTLNGKKCEVPVKRILLGAPPAGVVDLGALRNPDALSFFLNFDFSR